MRHRGWLVVLGGLMLAAVGCAARRPAEDDALSAALEEAVAPKVMETASENLVERYQAEDAILAASLEKAVAAKIEEMNLLGVKYKGETGLYPSSGDLHPVLIISDNEKDKLGRNIAKQLYAMDYHITAVETVMEYAPAGIESVTRTGLIDTPLAGVARVKVTTIERMAKSPAYREKPSIPAGYHKATAEEAEAIDVVPAAGRRPRGIGGYGIVGFAPDLPVPPTPMGLESCLRAFRIEHLLESLKPLAEQAKAECLKAKPKTSTEEYRVTFHYVAKTKQWKVVSEPRSKRPRKIGRNAKGSYAPSHTPGRLQERAGSNSRSVSTDRTRTCRERLRSRYTVIPLQPISYAIQ